MTAFIAAGYSTGTGDEIIVNIDLAALLGDDAAAAAYAAAILTNYAAAKQIQGETETETLARALWDLFSTYITPVAQKYIYDGIVAQAEEQVPQLSAGVSIDDILAAMGG